MLALLLLLLPPTLSCPYPNTTTNTTQPPPPPPCQTAYPSSLQLLSSRYPTNEFAPTHFFMLLRQSNDTLQVATQVQFQALPATAHACQLELVVPGPSFTTIYGPQPVFNVYAVEREAGAGASWSTYEGDEGIAVVGSVDGDAGVLDEARRGGGVVVVGTVPCNETVTLQMGMAGAPDGGVKYWDFVDVSPPATPVQGWRIVHSC